MMGDCQGAQGHGLEMSDILKQKAFETGALYADSNISAPTYAYLGDFGVFPALLMQNMWTQIRTGIPIVGYFSLLNSLISVSSRATVLNSVNVSKPTAGNSVQYIAVSQLQI